MNQMPFVVSIAINIKYIQLYTIWECTVLWVSESLQLQIQVLKQQLLIILDKVKIIEIFEQELGNHTISTGILVSLEPIPCKVNG